MARVVKLSLSNLSQSFVYTGYSYRWAICKTRESISTQAKTDKSMRRGGIELGLEAGHGSADGQRDLEMCGNVRGAVG